MDGVEELPEVLNGGTLRRSCLVAYLHILEFHSYVIARLTPALSSNWQHHYLQR
jgi:hypothetical protein